MAVDERTPVSARANRAHWFAGRVHEVLDDVIGLPAVDPSCAADAEGQEHAPDPVVCVSDLSAARTAEAIAEIARLQARMAGLQLRLVAHADRVDVAGEHGAVSTGAWLSQTLRLPVGQAHRMVRLAKALDSGPGQVGAATGAALLLGEVGSDQAQAVFDAVAALPAAVPVPVRVRAETHLLEEAGRHDARQVKALGKHLLHVVDPEAADAELARLLAAEEAAAARKTFLELHDDGEGICHGRFRIPTLHGAMLSTALNAIASPRRPDAIERRAPSAGDPADEEAGSETVPHAQVMGEALCQLLERIPAGSLPTSGGVNATVVVTIDLKDLLAGLGGATLSTGQRLTAGEVRRLACEAAILPAVFDGPSRLLDLGRAQRFHNAAQRTALGLLHRTCTAEGCQIPAAWCHAHHKDPWALGGRTDLADSTLLCARHHTMVHDPAYSVAYLDNGRTRITRHQRRRQ